MLEEGGTGAENIHQEGVIEPWARSEDGLEGTASGNEKQGFEEQLF